MDAVRKVSPVVPHLAVHEKSIPLQRRRRPYPSRLDGHLDLDGLARLLGSLNPARAHPLAGLGGEADGADGAPVG